MVKIAHTCLIQWRRASRVVLMITAVMIGVLALDNSLVFAQAKKTPANKSDAHKAEVSRTQALSLRVEELEEQIVDLQVVIGTLESLAKTGGKPSGATFTNGQAPSANGGRPGALEAQVKALSVQVANLSAEVTALQQGRGSRPMMANPGVAQRAPALGPPAPSARAQQGTSIGTGFGATTVSPVQAPAQVQVPAPGAAQVSADPIGSLIREPIAPVDARTAASAAAVATVQQPAAAPPVAAAAPSSGKAQRSVEDGAAKAIYDQAYGDLLQQDFANSQAGFRSFLRQFPKHALVPNALYWLGETYYVQQNYTDAAEAFDIVTAAYARSNKAPDSQLKRGMSLANLGKRSEACSVLGALAKRYPNAPAHVKSKADSERQRVGCT